VRAFRLAMVLSRAIPAETRRPALRTGLDVPVAVAAVPAASRTRTHRGYRSHRGAGDSGAHAFGCAVAKDPKYRVVVRRPVRGT
jgi:hypothetical protein